MRYLPGITRTLLLIAAFAALASSVPAFGNEDVAKTIEDDIAALKTFNEPDTAKFLGQARQTMLLAEKNGLYEQAANCYHLIVFYLCHNLETEQAALEVENMRRFVERHGEGTKFFYTAWQNVIINHFNDYNSLVATAETRRMAEYAKRNNDSYGLVISNILYGMLIEENNYEAAIENFSLALKHALRYDYQEKVSYIRYSMAKCALINDRHDDVLMYAEEMEQSEAPSKNTLLNVDYFRLRAYLQKGNMAEAQKYFKRLKSSWDRNEVTPATQENILMAMGLYLCRRGNADEALNYISKIENPSIKLSLTREYHLAKHDYLRAYKLLMEEDSIEIADLKEQQFSQVASANAIFNTQQLKEENHLMEIEKAKSQNQRNMIIIIALSVFMVVLIYIIYISNRHYKMQRKEKEREAELGIAQRIQQGKLPKRSPFGQSDNIDIQAVMTPAKEVGGDFYNYFRDGERLYFIIADVSGKGVPAALFMAIATELFMVAAPGETDPSVIVSKINNQMCRDNDADMFITMIVGILDLTTGEMQLCNAGHNPPFIVLPAPYSLLPTPSKVLKIDLPKSLPVGIAEGTRYKTERMTLQKGSLLLLYTDGVTEAENESKELFGEERLKGILETAAKDTCHAIEKAVHEFAGEEPQSDDITVMAVKYN